MTDSIISFIRSIGIPVYETTLEEDTFLPGLQIKAGELMVDKSRLLYPGDLLHEAGHIAVMPSAERPHLNEEAIKESKNRAAEEMMAIAWSYAATVYLDIDPLIVFHDNGYKGGGSNIAENFEQGHSFGVPMLQWCGMTTVPKRNSTEKYIFPNMKKWMRD